MSDERRFTDDEVAEILDRATTTRSGLPAPHRDTGTTLAELQEIGAEVGISPDRIEEAAHSVTVRPSVAPADATFLGTSRSAERTLQLKRGPSDEEWGRIIADLRQIFDAQGIVESYGTLRSWRNGNLRIDIEPADEGYTLRMRTVRGTGPVSPAPILLSLSLITGFMILTGETSGLATTALYLMTAAGGIGAIGTVARFRRLLPKWKATREDQMEALGERITRMLTDGDS
ncbi:MAG: hypothetical protein ACR2QM_09575 [Longimicrobiales bacterium]